MFYKYNPKLKLYNQFTKSTSDELSIAATKAIRAMERPDADIPIIAMTANAFADDVKRNKEAGMNDRISKPLDARRIISVLSRYIGK